MKNFICLLILISVMVSCRKETSEPKITTWVAHVRYESTVKKLPVYLSFHCGSVDFQKRIASRPSDASFVWDTTVVLSQFDSIKYEMKYFPLTNEYPYINKMFVLLTGKYRQITEIGFIFHYSTHIIIMGRVRPVLENYNSRR
ncbi:MAG TPA: hypothetical protein VFJ43_02075 [Bacteroidia bacterium]|nr:hypothetical protein [Bacteroidia bacterium]